MKIKTFILTFLMMMLCSISFGQELLTGEAKTESKLKQFLYNEDYGTITIGDDFSVSSTIEIPKGRKITIDLNGHKLTTNADIYIFKNFGRLTITDNSTDGKGTISSLGIYNGKPQTRTNTDDIDYTAQLTIKGGVFENISPNGGAAIYNHLGVIDIQGGEFYGEYSAITNFGVATIANAYIECLNRDNDAAAIINDFEIEYGNNVNVVGRYTAYSGTASITDGEATYLFAELNGVKYPSLQAALDACTTGDNTINLLFHNSDNATVSQKEGVNITIDGDGYKGKQFEYSGTITVDGKSAAYATAGLTIEDVKFNANNITKDASINLGGNNNIRYTSNVTVKNCTFEGVDKAKVAIKNYTGGCKNLVVKNCEARGLHSLVQVKGIVGVTVENVKVTDCKNGISVGTSDDVAIKGADIEAEGYGLRADGSGAYSLTVEHSTLEAEVPVIVRNTTGEYDLTVKDNATLTAPNGKPQVVVTAGKDDADYVVPTAKVNVTLYDNVTSTFGLTAKIGNAFYATLQDAVDKAKTGETVTLVTDCAETVTFTQTKDVSFVLDGNDKTYTGSINITARAGKDAASTLVIKDFNFETDKTSHDFIKSVETNYYPNNITITDCTFKGNSDINTDGYAVVAVRLKSANNIKIENCTGTGLHSFLQNTAGWNMTIDNVDINNSLSGFAMGTIQGVNIKNCEIAAKESGIRLDAQYNNNAVIESNEINAFIPVVVRKASVNGTITFDGTNVFTETNTDGLWCAIGTSEYKENGVMPTAATANISVTLKDKGLSYDGVYGNFAVAKIGSVQYTSFADAATASKDGETIELLWKEGDAPISMASTFVGNKTVTITGTADVDWDKGWLYVGRNGEGNGKLIFKEANLTSKSVGVNNNGLGLNVSCKKEGSSTTNDGKVEIINSNIQLDYLIGKGDIKLDNSTLNVYEGFAVGARPASETGEVQRIVTMDITNGSNVIVKNHNGQGLGYESMGIMNIDATSSFETTQAFLITANGTMNVNGGNVKTVGTLTNEGAVNVTGNASMNVNTLTGNAINFTNVTIANANIGGAVNAFGTNNFTGETNIEGTLSVGYNGSPAEQVVVNITGNFNGGNVLIGSSNDNVLNVGNAEGEKSTAYFGQLGAFGDVNIVNADVTYGYTFIRNDFNVTNSTMAINGGTNTYFSGNAKVVIDNSSWNLTGHANIGSYGGPDYKGNADVTLKNGSSMTATKLGVEQYDGKTVILTLEDSSTLTATNLSNTGSIVLANVQANVTSNELTGTNNVPTTTVADHKVVYENGAYVVTAKHYVAQVKGTDNNVRVKFETFAEALDAVENGETIELLGTEGSEISKELEFTKDIEFTITGNAPTYALPVVTFQNATVNIKDATILIPELDARQDATINVINSTVYDAGGNSIAKSYYNGAINISGTSEVYMMQVTTMGYINISGTAKLHATWQTNVYGNGLVTIEDNATFNTAALHLTAKDYSGRDNTDEDRVGKPAEIVVDGANFIVGNVQASNGADYSYNSSKGINVGTIEGKSAILNIKNGGSVNIYMANGETANIGAGGTVNVAASTLNTICRAENGTVTLANNGNVYVTGEANLAANVTGAGWFYMNGVALDADTKLHGAKVGFINGENTILASTIDEGYFSVGIGQNDAATAAAAFATANNITLGDVTVNVSENAIIGGNGETYSGWVGSAYSADKTEHTYTLNVENSLAAFGYMHVSKDGAMTINDHSVNKYTHDNANVDFYAGDLIVNGNVTINNADAWVKYTKMSADHADGVLNITGDTNYESSIHNGSTTGTSLVFYKAGKVNIAKETTIEIDNKTTLVEGAELNIASANVIAKGDVTGNGAINLTDLNAKFTAKEGLTIVDKVNNKDYKIAYKDGAYQFVAKQFVAQIYDVDNNTNDDRRYESLQDAIEAVAEGETVKLMADVTITESAYGQNALNHARAINFTLDLNGKTLSANTGNSVFRFNIVGSGATEYVTVTIKNGTVVSGEDTWCTLMSAGISADVRAVMNLEDLVIENYKGGDFAVKAWANGVVNAEGVTINSTYGGGFYAPGGEITLENCTVNQEGLWTAPYNSMAVAVSNGGKMTVISGTYSAVPKEVADGYNQGTSHGSWTGGVMSSGGTLIINGGTFSNGNIGGTATYPRELFIVGADADYGDNVNGQVIINGGTFTSIGDFIHCETIWGSANDSANDYMPTMGVTITAGDFTAVAGKTIGGCDPVTTGNPVDVEISGGTYGAYHAIENSYLVVGYIVVDNGNGTYSVVEDQVAKIGDVTYKLLHEAFDAAQDGDEIVVLKNITYTKDNGYVNGDYIDGLVYTGDKSFTVDFDEHTITDNGEINDYLVYLKNQGGKENEITFKNGTIAIKAESTKTAWAAITVGANSATYKTTLNLDNMKVVNGNPNNANNLVIRTRNGATVNLNNETVVTSNGTSYGVVAETGSIVNINNGAKVVHTNSGTTGGNLVYTAVSGNGTINIYDGATIESDNYAIHNMTSGNTVINIYGGTIKAPVAVHVATNGGNGQTAVANISGGTFNGSLETYTGAASIVITGGIFSVNPSDYCAENYGAFPYDENSWVVREISGEQTFNLVAGWNWVSSYITKFNDEGLAMLTNNLDQYENGKQIKNNKASLTYSGSYYGWSGTLSAVSVKEMYKINVVAGQTFTYKGFYENYDLCEIPLYKGWNYIGYPVNEEMPLADALANLDAKEGDMIKAQNGTAIYTEEEGWLSFDLTTLFPGEGYMYENTSDQIKVLRYTTKKSSATTETNNRSSKYWTVDATQYSSNMTMIAMTDVEGGNYEVAAFVNGEVRGSSRPVYVESLDAYILILTISGDDVEEMTFKCYDLTTGEEVEFSNRINYSNDAIVGSIYEPYMLTRGTTGIGEAAISQVNIYPNPTTTGTEINLEATCDKVEVFNALGVKVAEYRNVDTIDALETAGIYVIRITNNGNVQNCRLVVK